VVRVVAVQGSTLVVEVAGPPCVAGPLGFVAGAGRGLGLQIRCAAARLRATDLG
jgi:hypothetical protein